VRVLLAMASCHAGFPAGAKERRSASLEPNLSTLVADAHLPSNSVCGRTSARCCSRSRSPITDSAFDTWSAPAPTIGDPCDPSVGTFQRSCVHGIGLGDLLLRLGLTVDGLAEQNCVTKLRSCGDWHNEAATVHDVRKKAGNTSKVEFLNNSLDCRSGNATGGHDLHIEKFGGVCGNVHVSADRFRSTGCGPSLVGSGVGWSTRSGDHLFAAAGTEDEGAAVTRP
jgi:hypothetical protein